MLNHFRHSEPLVRKPRSADNKKSYELLIVEEILNKKEMISTFRQRVAKIYIEEALSMEEKTRKSFSDLWRSLPALRLMQRDEAVPRTASFMLYLFLTDVDRRAIPGDLEEEFWTEILPRYGSTKARLWYSVQVIRTIAYRNRLCRWLFLSGLAIKMGEWIMSKISG